MESETLAGLIWDAADLASIIERDGRQSDYPAFFGLLKRADYQEFCATRHQQLDAAFSKAAA